MIFINYDTNEVQEFILESAENLMYTRNYATFDGEFETTEDSFVVVNDVIMCKMKTKQIYAWNVNGDSVNNL